MSDPLKLKFDVYLQDPLVAREDPLFGFDEIEIPPEAIIFDGPTSSRFAVVDYNASTKILNRAAQWDEKSGKFRNNNRLLDKNFDSKDALQFHQVQVWATLQRALLFFEEEQGLGRFIPWGFDGNRLIVVPHAGYGQNAYYDRASKSLQFYYYNDPNRPGALVYTCLSADIIHHEFGHAVLDGIRPHLIESYSIETAAFHEFVGDMTALLLLLRNNDFRDKIAKKFGEDLSSIRILSGIADEFGRTVKNKSFLRNADNKRTLAEVNESDGPHQMSTVLTGAIFKIMEQLSKQYVRRALDNKGLSGAQKRGQAKKAFWRTIYRMHRMAIQPLDFLPPIDATFRDYALAMLRVEEISNPQDPYDYRKIMINEFIDRKILTEEDKAELLHPDYLYDRNDVPLKHAIAYKIGRCKVSAYHFVNENRKVLGIPENKDIIIADVYQSQKSTRQGRRLPTHYTLQYLWYEEVLLADGNFGEIDGEIAAMPCGATLVFDRENNLLHWANKPGVAFVDDPDILKAGQARLAQFKAKISQLIQSQQLGLNEHGNYGLFAKSVKPIVIEKKGGLLHFKSNPHLTISEHHQNKSAWEISF